MDTDLEKTYTINDDLSDFFNYADNDLYQAEHIKAQLDNFPRDLENFKISFNHFMSDMKYIKEHALWELLKYNTFEDFLKEYPFMTYDKKTDEFCLTMGGF